MSRRIVVAYWLTPTEPTCSYFQNIINDLAERYAAPEFEPHLTVHVGVDCTDSVDEALSRAARGTKRIALQVLNVNDSSEFIKTLFVTFAASAQLQRLNQSIRKVTQDSSDYQLSPHLSLLYKNMLMADRRRLARSIEVPFPEVAFDSLKAVRCISPTRSRADVDAWRIVAQAPLSNTDGPTIR